MENIKLNYDDVTIIPEIITTIKSRKECNPYDEFGRLPIFVSPMDTVISEENYDDFARNSLNIVVPRTVSLPKRLLMLFEINNFVAFSLAEAKDLFVDDNLEKYVIYEKIQHGWGCKICIDLANGHMQDLLDTVKEIKQRHPEIIIMTGNIANSETYRWYCEAGVDYVRVGIGGGCFTENMEVKTNEGLKKIKDIEIGDYVQTHTGEFKEVLEKHIFEKNGTIYKINGIECTENHEFYVVKNEDINKINDENIHEYAYWKPVWLIDKENESLVEL